jgi:hypothetical protein
VAHDVAGSAAVLAVVVVATLIALASLELQAAARVKALASHRLVLVSRKGVILVLHALELRCNRPGKVLELRCTVLIKKII